MQSSTCSHLFGRNLSPAAFALSEGNIIPLESVSHLNSGSDAQTQVNKCWTRLLGAFWSSLGIHAPRIECVGYTVESRCHEGACFLWKKKEFVRLWCQDSWFSGSYSPNSSNLQRPGRKLHAPSRQLKQSQPEHTMNKTICWTLRYCMEFISACLQRLLIRVGASLLSSRATEQTGAWPRNVWKIWSLQLLSVCC